MDIDMEWQVVAEEYQTEETRANFSCSYPEYSMIT
jgi:hypothetical protein